MLKVASLGSCLAGLTAAVLVSDYGCRRLNNLAMGRSDHFKRIFIDKSEGLPPVEKMEELLGLQPNDELNIHRFILENYPETAGVIDLSEKGDALLSNLVFKSFDLFILDNLGDTINEGIIFRSEEYGECRLIFPVLLAPNAEVFWRDCKIIPHLTVEQSVANWLSIINYLHILQPRAKIVFLCAPTCTSIDLPDRFRRAESFYNLMSSACSQLPVEIISPVDVPSALTKMPDDRDHFDMKVYRALAGIIYLSSVGRWNRRGRDTGLPSSTFASLIEERKTLSLEVDARPLQADEPSAEVDVPVSTIPAIGPGSKKYGRSGPAKDTKNAEASLVDVLADLLGVPAALLHEDAGVGQVDNWDSLNQLKLISRVEQVFGVSFPFDDIINATSVRSIRQVLLSLGVRCADDTSFLLKRHSANRNIFSSFITRASTEPDELFVTMVKGETTRDITNTEMLKHTLASALTFSHLDKGSIVAIVLDHTERAYSSFMGCALVGLVPTFLPPLTTKQDPSLYRSSMLSLLEIIAPIAIVCSRSTRSSLPETKAMVLVVEEIVLSTSNTLEDVERLVVNSSDADLAFLQHSSGTTGLKKGVMLSHHQVRTQAALYAKAIGMKENNVVASWLPLYHDMGLLTSFVLPAMVGCPIISINPLEWVTRPVMMLEHLQHADYAWMPNFAFHHILRFDDHPEKWDFHRVKALINCSEPCRTATFDQFVQRYERVGLGREKLGVSYAMAENVFAVTQTAIGQQTRSGSGAALGYLSCGPAFPDFDVRICTKDGEVVPDGEIGEIRFMSPCMFQGYFKRPELTKERIEDGWFKTGDLGVVVSGELFVVGRVDDLLIVNGKNIFAHEIEDQLNLIKGLSAGRVLVHALHDEDLGTARLIVLAEADEDANDVARIKSEIRTEVFASSNVAPSRVHLVPRGFLVKSSAGKLARSQSWQKYLEHKEDPDFFL